MGENGCSEVAGAFYIEVAEGGNFAMPEGDDGL